MTEKTPAEKMRLTDGMSATFLHVPEGMLAALGVSDGVEIVAEPGEADFLLEFATTQSEAEERLRALKPHVKEATMAWLAYPKGSKAAGYDLNRDTIWAFAQTIGLDFVANVSLDDTWSAMRMRPKK